MVKYRYQTTDAHGHPVSGEVEAAGMEDARQKLAAQGLDAEAAYLTEIPATPALVSPLDAAAEPAGDRGGRLSSDEAIEVASGIAELVKAGLPLAAGLRAMAQEVPRKRVARALHRLADRLETGMSLEAALESLGRRFPLHVRGLILAGIRTGRLAEAMEEFVSVEKGRIELRRRVRLAAAYPGILALLVVGLFIMLCAFVVPQFGRVYEESDAELPLGTQVLLWLAGPGLVLVVGLPALCVAGFLLLATARGTVWARRALYAVPLVGPVWWWAGLANLSRLMAMLLRQGVPLPLALRLTAAGLREADLAVACRQAADEVETGRPFSQCLGDFWQFPPSLRPLVQWGEQTSNPTAAFQAGAETFESRVGVYATLFQAVLPPLVFMLILVAVFVLLWGMFAPMVSLIQALT